MVAETVDPMTPSSELHSVPRASSVGGAHNEIVRPHTLVGQEASHDSGMVAEWGHTVHSGLVIESSLRLGTKQVPRGSDAVGIVNLAATGNLPYRTCRRDAIMLRTSHIEVDAAVALLRLESSKHNSKGNYQHCCLLHLRLFLECKDTK